MSFTYTPASEFSAPPQRSRADSLRRDIAANRKQIAGLLTTLREDRDFRAKLSVSNPGAQVFYSDKAPLLWSAIRRHRKWMRKQRAELRALVAAGRKVAA